MANGPIYGVIPIQHETVIAHNAIPIYRATTRSTVDPTTKGKRAKLPAAATDAFFGASNNLIAAADGDLVHIIQQGRAIGTANAAITRGQYLIMDASGKLGPATLVAGEQIIGIAEEDAAADGDFFAYTIRVFVF